MNHNIKRDENEVNAARQAIESLNETDRNAVENIIKKYESITIADWSEKDKYNENFVSDMVNDFGFNYKGVAKAMANDHCTLQQSFMRLCFEFIRQMSEKKYFDGRNEASVKLAKQIVESLGEEQYLPFV